MTACRRRWVVGSALALLLTGCAAIGRPPLDVPDGMEWDPATGLRSDVLEIDARQIAEDTGRPYDQVLAQLRAEQRLDDIVPEVEARYPAFVAVAWTDDGRLLAQFVGDAPAEALTWLEGAGVPVAPVSVRFGRAELDARQSAVVSVLRGRGATDYSVATDPWTQHILVSVSAADDVSEAAIRAALPTGIAQQDVSIDVVVGPVVVPFGVGGPPVARVRLPGGRLPSDR